jgi:cell division septation protein DedD
MSGGDYRNRPALHIPGKEFLIVIVVVFSSLSFILGYFVGKSRRDLSAEPPVRTAETVVPQKSPDTGNVQPPAEAPGGPDYPVPAEPTGENAKGGGEAPAAVEKPVSDPLPPRAHSQEHAGNSAGVVKPSSSKANLQKGTISYTVQIGALSNEKDAEDLRARYEKKGYEAHVVPAKNKRSRTIYKVRIGEFNSRKSAELLSVKLRRTEGLNTFVTFKDE